MKFFVGTMTAKSGKRDEFLALIRAHAVNTRSETGCIYFEVEPMLDRPDSVLLAECYRSAEDHRLHDETPYMKAFLTAARPLLLSADAHAIVADAPEHFEMRFD